MRKIKNKETINEISQRLLIKQKKKKKIQKKKIANCSCRNRTKKKKKRKTKVKVEIKTEIKPPKPPKKEKIKAPKQKRKNEINIDEIRKEPKKRKRSKKFSMDQIVERKIVKTRKKAIKGLVDFNNFIRNEVVESGQEKSFSLAACNVKREIINSYW